MEEGNNTEMVEVNKGLESLALPFLTVPSGAALCLKRGPLSNNTSTSL